MRTRKIWGAVLAVVTVLATAACGGGSSGGAALAAAGDARVNAAKQEGSVVWYTGSQTEAADAAAAAFKQKYGITVTVVRLQSADIAQRFSSEAKAGKVQADVLSTVDPPFFQEARKQGWTRALDASVLPSMQNWPKNYLLGNDAAVVFGIGPDTVAWNTSVLPGFTPSTWQDLLDPRLKGQVLLTDPRKSTAWAQMWSAVLHDPALGENYIKQFTANGFRQVVDSSIPGAQLLAAGEGGVLVASTITTTTPLSAKGAPVKQFTLENPAPVYQQYITVAADAPHPNASALFADWLLTQEGQSLYNGAHKQASPLGDLPGTVPVPKGLVYPPADQVTKDLPKIVQLLGLH